MENMKFILKLVEWAIIAGCLGTLADYTIALKKGAIESHKRGPMSLSKWTKKLETTPPRPTSYQK